LRELKDSKDATQKKRFDAVSAPLRALVKG
jgi:hypothetical protein